MIFRLLFAFSSLLLLLNGTTLAFQFDGSAQGSSEAVLFPERPAFAEQKRLSKEEQPEISPAFVYPALMGEAEFTATLTQALSLSIHPALRFDYYDRRRNLIDLPEAKLTYAQGSLRVRLGFDTESWGVMEYVNTTDVINQNDILDSFLSKRKLGQPMAAATWMLPLGTVDVYVLGIFRPMPFPGAKGRLGPGIRIDSSPLYQSDAERLQAEAAMRGAGQVGPIDFSVSYFHGYEREPRFQLGFDALGPWVRPEYRMSHQGGADAIWVTGNWIFKTENAMRIYEDGGKTRYAWSAGLERGFAGWRGQAWDATVYLEYLQDTREPNLILPFTHHLFAGMRVALNDAMASEATVSWIQPVQADDSMVSMGDLSIRPRDRLKIQLGGAWVISPANDSPLASLARDSHVRLKTTLYY
jgi:hypothetical protein